MVRIRQVIAVAILSIGLMGATTVEFDPACAESPEQYIDFLEVWESRNSLEIAYFLGVGCGLLRGGLPATVLDSGLNWIKIRVDPMIEGVDPIDLYTGPRSIIE